MRLRLRFFFALLAATIFCGGPSFASGTDLARYGCPAWLDIGGGVIASAQGRMAIEFYNDVAGSGNALTANISLVANDN